MKWLTKQECKVIGMVLLLLVTGWLVKEYRVKHPALAPALNAKP